MKSKAKVKNQKVKVQVKRFQGEVWNYWKESGRHSLPWRKTTNPYRILVSEVMLQQTQVPRVIPRYKEFIKKFPTARALAKAPLSDVLRVWSGLGYNRRAKYLHDTARVLVKKHKSKIPQLYSNLVELPGIGDYTANAVRALAYNEPAILIETNIRTAIIHRFASEGSALRSLGEAGLVHDKEILEIAQKIAKGQDPRQWHWALMDYGAHLKQSGVRNNARSAHYTKQSRFAGSLRELRGAILRDLHAGRQPKRSARMQRALAGLKRDGLIAQEKGKWRIA